MPSLWIIDGFNLLRQSRDLMEVEAKNLSQAKVLLLERLKKFSERSGERVVCVFDATGSVNERRLEEPHGSVKFVYSKAFETADEVIMEMAGEKKEGAVIVSSDREIQSVSEKSGSSTMSSQEFDRLLARLENSPLSREDEEGFDPKHGTQKKGPSHRRPKKERKVYSKIRKLF